MDYVKETLMSWFTVKHRFVDTDEARIAAVASKNAVARKLRLPHWVENGVFPRDSRAFASEIFFHNAVNFCYTDPSGRENGVFTVRYGRRTFRGSMAMAACFYRAFGEKRIKAGDVARHIRNRKAMERFFDGENRIPMLEERLKLLTETVTVLDAFFDGDPLNVFEEGGFRAFGENGRPGIVDILMRKFPLTFGQDIAEIDGRKLYFLKRPQLLVLEYQGRISFRSEGFREISDIDQIGPICDYELPKTYVEDKAMRLHPDLAEQIRRGQPLAPDSRAVAEIRGGTYWSVIKEVSLINEVRNTVGLPRIHVGHVDHGRHMRGKKLPEPHMLVRTTNF